MQTQIRDIDQTLVIDDRFQGLPEVAHGGYIAGVIADALGADSIEVRLRRPVSTGRRLDLELAGGERLELRDGEELLVEAAPAELAIELPPPVSAKEAEDASRRFMGAHDHPIPGCLVCGTDRHAGDGLRIFPGPVSGRRLVAAPWVPGAESTDASGQVPGAIASAALDCTQLWALIAHAPAGASDLVVTSGLELVLSHPVMPGEPHVVVGWPIERQSRFWLAGAAVIGPDGELCAIGRQKAAITSWGVPLGHRPSHELSNGHTHTSEGESDDHA